MEAGPATNARVRFNHTIATAVRQPTQKDQFLREGSVSQIGRLPCNWARSSAILAGRISVEPSNLTINRRPSY